MGTQMKFEPHIKEQIKSHVIDSWSVIYFLIISFLTSNSEILVYKILRLQELRIWSLTK